MFVIPFYILIALFVSFLWGIHPVLAKHLLKKFSIVSVLSFNNVLYFLAMIIFSLMNYNTVVNDFKRIDSNDALILLFVGLVSSFFANLLYYFVLESHESSLVSALVYSSPIFTLLFAYFFMKEKINLLGVLGILLIVLGVVCIIFNDQSYRSLNI